MQKQKWITLIFIFVSIFLLMLCSSPSKLADGYFRKGRAFEKAEEPDSALVQYQLAIQFDPKHMKANMAYQDLAMKEFGKDDEVWDTYEALAKKHPRDPVYQVLFTRLQENNDQKIEKALRIVDQNPSFFWGHYLLGTAYQGYRNRDYSTEAIESYEKAIQLDSTDIELYIRIARLCGRVDDYQKMKRAALKALSMDSTRTDLLPLVWQSEFLLAANQDSAKTALSRKMDTAFVERSSDTKFLNALVNMMYSVDPDRIPELEKKIIVLDPKGPIARNEALGNIYSEENPKEGMKKAEAFLKNYPDGNERYEVFDQWLRFAQKVPGIRDEDVETAGKKYIGNKPDEAELYSLMTSYYSRKYSADYAKQERLIRLELEARSSIQKADPLDKLGNLYLKQNKVDDALQALLEADSLSRKYLSPYPSLYSSLGKVYERKGNLDRSLEYYSLAVGLNEEDAILDEFYSVYEKKFGSREGAKKFINEKILTGAAVKKPFPMPEFTLKTMEDKEFLSADLRGKVALVAIWNPG